MQSRFHLDPVDWYREPDAVPHLAVVADAVWSDRQLSMSYESWRDEAERIVHPLGLVLKAGVWYLVAASDGKPRTYRISNIKRAALLEQRARRPARFDLASYWGQSVARFEADLYTDHADVLATPVGLQDLRYLNAAAARAVAGAKPSRRRDGRVALRIPVESVEHGAGQLLRLAPEVEVTGPGRLREAMVLRLKRVAALYGC
jgi:predicted DNA-binding transcriptional regulator YafY